MKKIDEIKEFTICLQSKLDEVILLNEKYETQKERLLSEITEIIEIRDKIILEE
jgi:hypothetical protein